jgi:hypothetical protein
MPWRDERIDRSLMGPRPRSFDMLSRTPPPPPGPASQRVRSVFGELDMPAPPPRNGLMDRDATPLWSTLWNLTPFAMARSGGHDLARGVAERDPGALGWGALALGGAAVPLLSRARPPWPSGRATAESIDDVLGRFGVTDVNRTTAATGTQYWQFRNPREPDGATITIRRPTDRGRHPGNYPGDARPGDYFDLARGRGSNPFNASRNVAGGRFENWDSLLPALWWRLSPNRATRNWDPGMLPRGLTE